MVLLVVVLLVLVLLVVVLLMVVLLKIFLQVANLEINNGSSLPYVPFNLPRELPRLPTDSEQTAVTTNATKEDIKYMFPGEIDMGLS